MVLGLLKETHILHFKGYYFAIDKFRKDNYPLLEIVGGENITRSNILDFLTVVQIFQLVMNIILGLVFLYE